MISEMAHERVVRPVAPYQCPSHWMIGAKTHLMDRVKPAVEYIYLPPVGVQAGEISFGPIGQNSRFAGTRSGLKGLLHKHLRSDKGVGRTSGVLVDMREHWPDNWAHSLIYHVPIMQLIKETFGSELTAVLPFKTPRHIVALFNYMSFQVIKTDQEVYGTICPHRVSDPDCLRSIRRELVLGLIKQLDDKSRREKDRHLPDRIYIARKKTRVVENEAEVEAYLGSRGYEKVYPETLGVAAQLDLFNGASEIVAIHGAAIAPLLYRSPSAPPVRLVELLAPGHMTNAYRVMTAQVGGSYVGVRGRIKPQVAEGAYKLSGMFTKYSLDGFEVDLTSLEKAFELQESNQPPGLSVAHG